jgi:ABC-type amino acid transport substrate-binding protein
VALPPTAEPGVLRVGIDDSPPPPMELGEPGEDDFRGYEVDILEAVAERLGLELRYRRAVWSQIIEELKGGLIDVICTAATYDALLDGRADAVVDDSPIAAWFVAERDGLRLIGELPGTASHYAMVFAKDSPLRAPLDAELERLESEGRLAEWRRTWLATS